MKEVKLFQLKNNIIHTLMRGMKGKLLRLLGKSKGKQKEVFITGLNSDLKDLPYRALLYFKTDPFVYANLVDEYIHPNVWEVTEIVAILNRLGFAVDLIDRSANDFVPDDIYELYVGLGSGGSGRHFAKYAQKLPGAVKILYATGTNPTLANQLGLERYQWFSDRTKIHAEPMRLRKEINIDEFAAYSDYIFCYGERDSFAHSSYGNLGKPLFPVIGGINPIVRFSPDWLNTRKRNYFICFAGNGFIYKGVDLVVEAFLKVPECQLFLCGPDSEMAFFDAYGRVIAESPNIVYEGFVDIGGERFEELCAQCSFVILHSSSEACATSVTTMMGTGMIPLVNSATSVNIGEFGFLMSDQEDIISDIVNTVRHASTIDDDEYVYRVLRTLEDSIKYTQASFTRSFTKALVSVMQDNVRFWNE